MSNDYYEYGNTLLPGEKARAEDVASEFQGVASGFELMPQPRPDGNGFLVSFKVPDATDPEHVANLGQLQTIQTTVTDARDTVVSTAADVSDDKDLVVTYRGETLAFRNAAEGFRDDAQVAASAAQSSAGLPALAGNALLALIVNATESGVEYGVPDVTSLHYTKTQSDGRYYTRSQIDTNHYTKAEIDDQKASKGYLFFIGG